MIFIMKWIDDEVCEIELDNQPVITINHDEHGWDGMTAVQDAVVKIAEIAGIKVLTIGEPGV
jgi:hypothetical protein